MMVSKKTYLWDALEFVGKAVSKDVNRLAVQNLFYAAEEKVIVGTDGKRMHIARNIQLGDESYQFTVAKVKSDRLICKVETDITYPNWGQVYPKHQDEYFWSSPGKEMFHYLLHCLIKDMDRVFDIRFLLDLTETNKNKELVSHFRVFETSTTEVQHGPVFFKNGSLEAVIMPMKR